MKQNKLRITAAVLAGLMTAGITAGCGSTTSGSSGSAAAASGSAAAAADTGKTITVITKSLDSDYWHMVQAGAVLEGKELGYTIDVEGPATEADIDDQKDMIEQAVENGTDAIVIAMIAEDPLSESLQAARDAGIPVIAVDSPAENEEDADAFAGTDNYAAGKALGEYIAEQQTDPTYAVIRGAKGSKVHNQRVKGICKALDEAGAKYTETRRGDSDTVTAEEQTEVLLNNYPDLTAIAVTSDDMAVGVIQAVSNAGLEDQVTVYGYDGASNGLQAIEDGTLAADCAQMPIDMGRKSVELCDALINGEQVSESTDTGYEIVDSSSVKDFSANVEEQMEEAGY